jgi:hypothetical protein
MAESVQVANDAVAHALQTVVNAEGEVNELNQDLKQ